MKDSKINLRISSENKKKIKQIAKEQGTTVSELLLSLIPDDYQLKEEKEVNK